MRRCVVHWASWVIHLWSDIIHMYLLWNDELPFCWLFLVRFNIIREGIPKLKDCLCWAYGTLHTAKYTFTQPYEKIKRYLVFRYLLQRVSAYSKTNLMYWNRRNRMPKYFCVSRLQWEESIAHWWIPRKETSDAELWCLMICAWIHDWENDWDAGNLRHRRALYDVTVMVSG